MRLELPPVVLVAALVVETNAFLVIISLSLMHAFVLFVVVVVVAQVISQQYCKKTVFHQAHSATNVNTPTKLLRLRCGTRHNGAVRCSSSRACAK